MSNWERVKEGRRKEDRDLDYELARLQAENAALRKDAARYCWLKQVASERIAAIAWRAPAATKFGTPDEAIDAVMGSARSTEEK